MSLPPLRVPFRTSRNEPQPAARSIDGGPMLTDAQRKASADFILRRHAERHGEATDEPEHDSISPAARAILDAGKRRRNEAA